MASCRIAELVVGVIGCGYWGEVLIRNLLSLVDEERLLICDTSAERIAAIHRRFPGVAVTLDPDVLFNSDISAVVIATPPETHASLASKAIRCGLHVLVEKPPTLTSAAFSDLVELARSCDRILLCDQVFLFDPAVRWLRQVLSTESFGRLHWGSFSRLNRSPRAREDVNVVWDLMIHDIYLARALLGRPLWVNCDGVASLSPTIVDTACARLTYREGAEVWLQASWYAPEKTRVFTLVFEKKMVVVRFLDSGTTVSLYEREAAASQAAGDGRVATEAPMAKIQDRAFPYGALNELCATFLTMIHHGVGGSGSTYHDFLEIAFDSLVIAERITPAMATDRAYASVSSSDGWPCLKPATRRAVVKQ